MKRDSGFVPINFRLVGKFLLPIGMISIVAAALSSFSGWFELPRIVLYFGLAAIPVSIYLIFVPPKES
jgi:hypothetical protein